MTPPTRSISSILHGPRHECLLLNQRSKETPALHRPRRGRKVGHHLNPNNRHQIRERPRRFLREVRLCNAGWASKMMHNCPPPLSLLGRWLHGAAHINGDYGHILLEQVAPIDAALIDGLRPHFESAHLDAREVFHRAARIDLHPDANGPGGNAQYPNCLPPTAKKGLFGEIDRRVSIFIERSRTTRPSPRRCGIKN